MRIRSEDRKQPALRPQAGYTLVEALVTVALFVLLLGACLWIFMTGSDSWQVNDAKISVQQELRKAVDHIQGDLRQAGPGSVINVLADDTWYSSISFRTASGVTGGSITWSTNPVQYSLGGPGNTQLLRVSGAQTRIIAQDMQTLQFRRLSTEPEIVEVHVELQKLSALGRPVTLDTTFQVELRN